MTLSYRADPFILSEASEDIGEIYEAIADSLPKLGFTGVRNEPGHVFATKDGCLLDVLYLFNSGRNFWQVVICSGPVQATNDQLMDQVKAMIAGFRYL